MRGLSFLLNGEHYAVDVTLVEKVMRKMTVTPVPSAPDEVIGIANLKGRVVTVLSLHELLGLREKQKGDYYIHAVKAIVFKSFSDGKDQIGLHIDEPGNLIDIDDNAIRLPSLPTGAEESFCISGIAETGNTLYRIINIDSIISKYKIKRENVPNGGIENE